MNQIVLMSQQLLDSLLSQMKVTCDDDRKNYSVMARCLMEYLYLPNMSVSGCKLTEPPCALHNVNATCNLVGLWNNLLVTTNDMGSMNPLHTIIKQ